MNTCSNCKWWNQERAVMVQNEFTNMEVVLAYCEPINPECTGMWKGLTAEDYFCGEWTEKERDDD